MDAASTTEDLSAPLEAAKTEAADLKESLAKTDGMY